MYQITLLNILSIDVLSFSIVFSRLCVSLMLLPIFGSNEIPKKFILILSAYISVLVVGGVSSVGPEVYNSRIELVLLLIKNMTIGLIIGTVILITFEIIGIIAGMIAYATGLGMSQMIDPTSSENSSVVSNVLKVFVCLLFISCGGIQQLYNVVIDSFLYFPANTSIFEVVTKEELTTLLKDVFILALIIAIPFTGSALLLNCSLAVISKAAPSMNLFTIGFPLSVLLGIITLGLFSESLVSEITISLINLIDEINEIYE